MPVVLDLLMCRPSCRSCWCVGLRAGVVDVSAFMPKMWLSAFVSTFFLQVLETSPCRGGATEIFNFSLQLGFLSCYSRTNSFFQRHSGASSNHVGGLSGSHVRASPAGASPGSHVGPSPARAPSGSQLSWAARRLVYMHCTCELGIMCTFGYVVCM
jgi:hypothetical protein